MTKRARLFTYALTAVLICLFILPSMAVGGGARFASAAASSYASDVLDDLRTDAKFSVDGYPAVRNDYSLQVIQIAESEQGELLIYVYQPAAENAIKASSINIARQENAAAEFDNYTLTYLNSNGVFYKYSVDGFELSTATVRYYNISNILRPYDKIIDEPPATGQTETEVPNAVGQLWTVYPNADSITYEPSTVITVTEKYVGFVNYDADKNLGFITTQHATSAHFVAFDTDKPVDQLISADVSFNERDVTYQLCANSLHQGQGGHSYQDRFNYQYGNKVRHEPDPITVTHSDVTVKGYTWDRIRRTSDFLADENNKDYHLTSEGTTGIERTKWVLNFYETDIQAKSNGKDYLPIYNFWVILVNGVKDVDCKYTEVSDVMILRLKYKYDGETYNVGVVDNKQTGSGRPSNGQNGQTFWEWLAELMHVPEWAAKLIFSAVVITVALIILGTLCAIFPAFKHVLNGILAAVFFPITGIYYLIKAIGNRRERRAEAAATARKAPKKKRKKKGGKK